MHPYNIHCQLCKRSTPHELRYQAGSKEWCCNVCDTFNPLVKKAKAKRGDKFHSCPECDTSWPSSALVDGKLPAHYFNGRVCEGSLNPAEGFNKNPRRNDKAIAQAKRLHRDFTGREAAGGGRMFKLPKTPRAGVVLGRLIQVGYESTRDGQNYLHRFRAKSRPLLMASHDGRQALIVGGRFVITGRGIVDK